MTSINESRLQTAGLDRLLGGLNRAWRATTRYRAVLVLDIVLVVVFAIKYPDFATGQNIQNILTGVAVLWIVAMGMTFSMVSGGADLSVGALVALDGFFLAKLLHAGASQWLALIGVLVFGAAVGGIVNGVLIGRMRLGFFVVTLASMTALTGVVSIWSGTNALSVNSSIVNGLASDSILGIQDPIWLMAVVFLIALYVQKFTYLGRDVYATGGSEQAARLSGIHTTRTLIIVYAIVGIASAIAAVVTVSQIGVASPQIDGNLPLEAIAAALLGGTALGGGSGGVGGTVFGVIFLGVLANGLSLSGVPSFWQQVLTGVILVAAVLGNRPGANVPKLRGWLRRGAAMDTAGIDSGQPRQSDARPDAPDAPEFGMPEREPQPAVRSEKPE